MPINEKDLGKYNRPGIFIEEINNSTVNLPIQDVLINLVPGFSKKGPFNKPVFIDNPKTFESIYGTIDRQLENKGSYFHRTVEKMLETGPVWALSLLSTDPVRDKLQWASVSTSASYTNDDFSNPNTTAYSSFFNRQDFWERDDQSFLDIVNNPQQDLKRLLHLTNMGDKTITVFLLKSTIEGFNVTAEDWYGGVQNVPKFINPKDWISDYIISVLVLAGDWTNYNNLKVDTTWSKYFTTSGLDISKLSDFTAESNVTVLGNYDVSLIPYFKDLNKKDLYIKSVINNNTDITGLFCAYDEDQLLGSDYLTKKIDIIGSSVVGDDVNSINYLSYNETIVESIPYLKTNLNAANNVFTTNSAMTAVSGTTRISSFMNNITSGIRTNGITTNGTTATVNLVSTSGYYNINGIKYSGVTTTAITFTLLTTPNTSRVDIVYLDTTSNTFKKQVGTVGTYSNIYYNDPSFDSTSTIILFYVVITQDLVGSNNATYSGVTINDTAYIGNKNIVITTDTSSNKISLSFTNTSYAGANNANKYIGILNTNYYNEMVSKLALNQAVGINYAVDNMPIGSKYPISYVNSVDYTSSTDSLIELYFTDSLIKPSNINNLVGTNNELLIYYIDNELQISSTDKTLTSSYSYATTGIVAKYSQLYQDYLNGVINTGDYFYISNNVLNTKIYLKMYFDNNGMLNVYFTDVTLSNETTPGFTPDDTTGVSIYSDKGSWKQSLEIDPSTTITDLTTTVAIKVDKIRYSEIVRGDFVEAYYDEAYYTFGGEGYLNGEVPRKLTRIINIKNDVSNSNLKILYTDSPIKLTDITSGGTHKKYFTNSYPSIYKYADTLKGLSIKPFKIHQDSLPNGTEERLQTITGVLGKNTSLYYGLINKNKISWRYLVDSFGLGLTDSSKQDLVDLCGGKLNCIGFLNMPSAKDFKKSNNPIFVDSENVLSTAFIKAGGDQDKNPDFLYSFGTGVGTSCVGYFFPYLKINDNGIPKLMPPASYVATTYMQKHISNLGGVNEWTVNAGISNGRIVNITGTEIDFTENDLANMYSMGANVITYKINNGYVINSESTAQVFPYSSLSLLHSRELLIELENQMYDMLLRYQWKFNTASIRAEIKYRADKICKNFLDLGGLYDFKNVMDESNNTPYIIDLQGGVLDTAIEIVKGFSWIVNNITIEKTGGIKSSGFGA